MNLRTRLAHRVIRWLAPGFEPGCGHAMCVRCHCGDPDSHVYPGDQCSACWTADLAAWDVCDPEGREHGDPWDSLPPIDACEPNYENLH